MSERLLPCPSCNRHIKVSEAQCPFCAGAVPAGFGEGAQRVRPAPRLSRAALFALGSIAVAPVACAGEATDEDQKEDADEDGNDGAGGEPTGSGAATSAGGDGAQPVYGAPADGGDANSSGGDSGDGGDTSQPEYGAPVSSGGDQPVPIYGAAPVGRDLPKIKK